ncbi:hypothetical protein DB30_07396 [Enhygromyxa salina]|uniref:Endo-1,4-beta-xylanase A n=2 Tax=Enhygromyxa salina TaxID=215803 RepID=A0A0C2CWI5_9BACT|nr:hypothetical protein DB30_07396 [Enhygromyxa salina]
MTTEDSGDFTDTSSTSSDSGTDSSSDTSDDTGDSGDSEDTSDETGGDETGDTGGPIPDACEVVDLGGNEGVTTEIVLMSQWDTGACHEIYVTNQTRDDVIWTRDLRFGGTVDNYWNAEGEQLNSTDWRFGGQPSADNIVVLSGKTVVFGSCMVCAP